MAKNNTTVRIDTAHEQMLVSAAENQGSTQSEVIREALGDYFRDLCDRDEEFAKS
jgi:predicted DNA-binding protein